MAYNYYQQNAPGWGTSQFQFGAPPAPNFQPQPSWGGMDYYRAHATSPDPSLFDHAWNRVRDYNGSSLGAGGTGVGMNESKHWHRRAYGGLGELSMMLPEEIGHAAAYEAYRTWIHNSSIYEPLSGDIERQREGLIGLAVAEASRLLQYANRPMDNYSRMAASEAAAATASIIFYHSRERREGEEYRSRSRSRRGSFSGGGGSFSGGGGSFSGSYEDPYAYDNAASGYPRQRSRSRSRHNSMVGFPSAGMGPSPMSMAIPSASSSGYGMSGSGMSGSYPSSYGSYGSQYGGHMPMQMGGQMGGQTPMYAGAMPGMAMSASYNPSAVPMALPMGSSRHRSTSFSAPYAQSGYMNAGGMMMPQMGIPQTGIPQAIMMQQPHRKHHHHHHKKHHKRSRSTEPMYSAGYATSARY